MRPQDILEAMDALHGGAHPDHRGAHAKGTLCAGTFTATAAATQLSRAAHLQGDPVRVTVRFSNGAGDPGRPDNDRSDGRGMAVKFYLPDGSTTDVVALTLPVFFVRTAADFLEFLHARRPDPETGQPDFEKIGAFVGAHPETQAALQLVLPSLNAPASYATCAYNSLHAFFLVAPDGTRRAVRYRFEPEAGILALGEEEAAAKGPDYLQEEIRDRFPFAFRMYAIVGGDGDPTDDPTVPWPDARERIELGRLELTGIETARERDGDVLVFDPTRVTDGIELSDDDILRVRSDVYAVSVERRSGVTRTAAP